MHRGTCVADHWFVWKCVDQSLILFVRLLKVKQYYVLRQPVGGVRPPSDWSMRDCTAAAADINDALRRAAHTGEVRWQPRSDPGRADPLALFSKCGWRRCRTTPVNTSSIWLNSKLVDARRLLGNSFFSCMPTSILLYLIHYNDQLSPYTVLHWLSLIGLCCHACTNDPCYFFETYELFFSSILYSTFSCILHSTFSCIYTTFSILPFHSTFYLLHSTFYLLVLTFIQHTTFCIQLWTE